MDYKEQLTGEIHALEGAIRKQGEYAADVELTSTDEFEIEYLWDLHSLLVKKLESKREQLAVIEDPRGIYYRAKWEEA